MPTGAAVARCYAFSARATRSNLRSSRSRAAAERQMMRMVFSPPIVPRTSGYACGVDRLGDRLRAAGDRLEHEQFPDAVARREELRKDILERRAVIVTHRVRRGVARPSAPSEPARDEVAQVARQRRLRDRPAALVEQLAQLLLAGDGLGRTSSRMTCCLRFLFTVLAVSGVRSNPTIA